VRWSEASRARRAIELDKIGTTTELVLLDLRDAARDNPALEDELARCKSDEERERLAFEWFEDHPQPIKRSNWLGWRNAPVTIYTGSGHEPTFRTPNWPGGWLPTLEDDEEPAAAAKPSALPPLRGESQLGWYTHGHLQGAARRLDRDAPVNEVAARTRLTPDDARRLRLLLERELASVSGGQLVFHVTLARKRDLYALRYLDERGERWLDPNRTLLQR
jgi:hypothetical protein